nr:MAG TPA: hypothetical protein [Caudoviricetes sp.]
MYFWLDHVCDFMFVIYVEISSVESELVAWCYCENSV